MDHRIPRRGLVVLIVAAALAVLTFIALNETFEGPGNLRSAKYELVARFDDTEMMPSKQPVLVHGVEVGKVVSVEYDKEKDTGIVRFSVDDDYAPVYRDASVFIGDRTLLGDPYLGLDPGTKRAGEMPGGTVIESKASVDFDEALDFLDAEGRDHVRSTLSELETATERPGGGERLNATVHGLDRTIHNLRELTGALRGQSGDLAGMVQDTGVVLDELSSREAAVRSIVGAGRTTLDALAADEASLSEGVAELPGLASSARRVLREARPLLREARPVIADLRRAAPEVTPVLVDLPSVTAETIESVSELAGLPTLRELLKVVATVGPLTPDLGAAARNLVTLLRFSAPRTQGIMSFLANMASVTAHGDDAGKWARFAILVEPGEGSDTNTPAVCEPEDDVPANAGFCHNAYPEPGDALDPEPYRKGAYPRLRAYDPPPPEP